MILAHKLSFNKTKSSETIERSALKLVSPSSCEFLNPMVRPKNKQIAAINNKSVANELQEKKTKFSPYKLFFFGFYALNKKKGKSWQKTILQQWGL
jgi:hypothetical protein